MTTKKITIWTFSADPSDRLTAPIKTTCDEDEFGYPHYDDDGRQMFENTHFRAEADAWERLIANANAGENWRATSYRQAQKVLADATKDLAEAAAFAVEVRRAHDERFSA